MSNISNISSVNLQISSAKLDGIQFNNIQKKGYNSTTKYVRANTPWSTLDAQTPLQPAVNAVDIDWNAAVIPYGNLENGDSATVNSTGELLSLISQISKMQQVAHYTVDSITQNGQENFYNDLLSNKKVYIENKPVIYYREILNDAYGDAAPDKIILAYTLADHMGVPYAIRYYIPIILSEEVLSEDIYNYFSPTVLIEVSNTSTTYSSIEIKIDNDIIEIPIDNYATEFLQSCDILAYIKGDNSPRYYWRLDGMNLGVKFSTGITRYFCPMKMNYENNLNNVYRVNITWDLNAKTITTLMD